MKFTFYCYFKVSPINPVLHARLAAMQKQLAAAGIAGRLMQRRDDAHTWMEVYEDIDDCSAFYQRWQTACLQHEVADVIRHEEWFQPLNTDGF